MVKQEEGITVLQYAVSHSKSLRSTVPTKIIKKLGLEQGSHIEWDIEKIDEEWVAIVRKKGRSS